MLPGNCAHDRKSQTAADGLSSGHAIEPVKHALALCRWNTCTSIPRPTKYNVPRS